MGEAGGSERADSPWIGFLISPDPLCVYGAGMTLGIFSLWRRVGSCLFSCKRRVRIVDGFEALFPCSDEQGSGSGEGALGVSGIVAEPERDVDWTGET